MVSTDLVAEGPASLLNESDYIKNGGVHVKCLGLRQIGLLL